MAKLYGIGVGPGDRELITLKAIRALRKVDLVVAPSSKGQKSTAYDIAKPYIKSDVMFMEFPMIYSKEDLRAKWEENAGKIEKLLDEGKDIAFITLGDPMTYSTYIYILERMKGRDAETIPGISSYSAAASELNIPVAKGGESFAVISSEDMSKISTALDMFDNVILLKVSKRYPDIVHLIKERSFKGYMVVRCGLKGEEICYDLDKYAKKNVDYLSLIIAKKVHPS